MTSELVWRSGDRAVPIELCPSPRALRMTLRVDAVRGAIRLSLHPRTSSRRALAMLDAHRDWIEARVAKLPVPKPFAPDATVPIEGRQVRIDWTARAPRAPVLDGDRLRVGGPIEGLPGRVERFLRAHARAVLEADTRALADQTGHTLRSVSVRDPASRWGSCSGNGAIAYSWRLILAPPDVRRSVVAHEVAHLAHMNHGPAFWALARELYGGDHSAARRWLRRHGPSLHWIGRSV